MTICAKSAPKCPVVNVGAEEAVLIGDLAERVGNTFGVKANVPQLTSQAIDRYVPAITKALEMGCKQPFSLNEAINKTIHAINIYNPDNEYRPPQSD
jgi:nucleoside-diphosphate-sugar epimerase